jgi:autotransporter-associated beta strand protein
MTNQAIAGFTTTGEVSMTKQLGQPLLLVINGAGLTINGGSGGTLHLGTALNHTFSGAVDLTAGTLSAGSSTKG